MPREINMGLTFVVTCTATEMTSRILAASREPPKYGRVKEPGVVDMKEIIWNAIRIMIASPEIRRAQKRVFSLKYGAPVTFHVLSAFAVRMQLRTVWITISTTMNRAMCFVMIIAASTIVSVPKMP